MTPSFLMQAHKSHARTVTLYRNARNARATLDVDTRTGHSR